MSSSRTSLLLVCAVTVVAGQARAVQDYDTLGRFEKESVDAVLAETGFQIEPDPAGKVVRALQVFNLEVFSDSDGFLSFFNIFHWTTRREVIEREVLLRPGTPWNQDLVDESVRRIRDPILSNVVVLLPLKTDEPGKIDLLVVTRDVWSLRLNSNFQLQSDELTLLSISVAENNFLGLRKKLSFTFDMNQSIMSFGPSYSDPNIAGTRLTLGSAVRVIFGRESGEYEGTASGTALAYPLWSLATPWGGSIAVEHFDGPIRFFQGTGQLGIDPRGTPERDLFRRQYHLTTIEAGASATYSTGTTVKQRVSFGYEFFVTEASVMDGFPGDAAARAAFAAEVLPRSELSSALFAKYRLFTPTFQTYRDFRTYDLREDYLVGPDISYKISQAATMLGSDASYTRLVASAEYAFDPGLNSYVKFGVGWAGRFEDGDLIDQRLEASLFAATPKLWNVLRLVLRADLDARFDETQNRFFTVGGDSGLRGHEVGQFSGERRVRLNLEARSMPLAWYFFRFGAVVFYDAAHVAERFEDLELRHDVGFGLRILIPQANPFVIRLDLAFPTRVETGSYAPRFSAGFFQAF